MQKWMLDEVEQAITQLSRHLLEVQQPDGRWSFCFEGGVMTDVYQVLLLKMMGIEDVKMTDSLLNRILAQQTAEGTWKLFADEKEGNRSATIEASLALLYSKRYTTQDDLLKRVKEFLQQGTSSPSSLAALTKVVLTILGHLSWSSQPRIPVEFLLLPTWSPINFFDIVGYARVHVAPILLLADRQFTVKLPEQGRIKEWLAPGLFPWLRTHEQDVSFQEAILHTFSLNPTYWHQQARNRGREFMLQRVEADGTLYSYFTTTFLMVLALRALGYSPNHPVIQRAMTGVKSFLFPLSQGAHLQVTDSTIWDTSLILYALQEAGISPQHPSIGKGVRYLLARQQSRVGDWALRNAHVLPGGWGFSDVNTLNPDVDDTSACLRAIHPVAKQHPAAWRHGVNWLLSMQNADGGWPAFEKNTDKPWLKILPYPDAIHVLGDPSTADLTGRALEFIGHGLGWGQEQLAVKRAVEWLVRHQERDGSWRGRWGICYIYGTWAALTGYAAVHLPREHPSVTKGLQWLLSKQNPDGGWGESCRSDQEKRYISLGISTPSQTAWALDALIAYYDQPTPQIERGIQCLLHLLNQNNWATTYPTGAGLAEQFYVNYHSYRYIWPLVTLGHYRKKYTHQQEN